MERPTETMQTSSVALSFKVLAKCSHSKARASLLTLPHQSVQLPVFMPVGTQGTMKGISCHQLKEHLDCEILLGNTYHLGHRPGPELLEAHGGLHKFMDWDRAILTDSGGFQMVSLLSLADITEEGVTFQSPHDQSQMLLTPEQSISLQNSIGGDIMMQLDDVCNPLSPPERLTEAMYRSVRWLDRCLKAHRRPTDQNLFPIIQGGLDKERRSKCIQEMVLRDAPGYAIGGLGGGEAKEAFCDMVNHCTDLLPRDKPIYCMGIGYDTDLIVCVAMGVDMFDCVFPTRTARFGHALTPKGDLSLKQQRYAYDLEPIDRSCPCYTCTHMTRAYLHGIMGHETLACHYLTLHNLYYQLDLMRRARKAIQEDRFPAFVQGFLDERYPLQIPDWVISALARVNIFIQQHQC